MSLSTRKRAARATRCVGVAPVLPTGLRSAQRRRAVNHRADAFNRDSWVQPRSGPRSDTEGKEKEGGMLRPLINSTLPTQPAASPLNPANPSTEQSRQRSRGQGFQLRNGQRGGQYHAPPLCGGARTRPRTWLTSEQTNTASTGLPATAGCAFVLTHAWRTVPWDDGQHELHV